MRVVSKCFPCLLLMAIFLGFGATTTRAELLLTLTDDYGNPNGGFTKFARPQATALQSTNTDFMWSGYASGTFFAFLNNSGSTLIDSRVGSTNFIGNYAYTIFDSSGGNNPDKLLYNLQTISAEWTHGGAGTAEAAFMIRDGNGDWFLSADTVPIASNTAPTLDARATDWLSLAGTTSTLNDVTDDDTGPLTIGAPGTPNLLLITGGGYLLAHDTNAGVAAFRSESITFTGKTPEPTSLVLLGLGTVTALIARRRRQRSLPWVSPRPL